MAAVDLNNIQFWAPPTYPFLYKQRTPSSQSMGRPICTNSSRNQPAPLYNKEGRTFKRNDQSKSAVTAARHPGDDTAAGAQGTIRRDSQKLSLSNLLWESQAAITTPLTATTKQTTCHRSKRTWVRFCGKSSRQKDARIPKILSIQAEAVSA